MISPVRDGAIASARLELALLRSGCFTYHGWACDQSRNCQEGSSLAGCSAWPGVHSTGTSKCPVHLLSAKHQTSLSLLTPASSIANFDASASHSSNALKLFSETPSVCHLLVWPTKSMDGAIRQTPSQLPSFGLKRFPNLLPRSLVTLLRGVCAV